MFVEDDPLVVDSIIDDELGLNGEGNGDSNGNGDGAGVWMTSTRSWKWEINVTRRG